MQMSGLCEQFPSLRRILGQIPPEREKKRPFLVFFSFFFSSEDMFVVRPPFHLFCRGAGREGGRERCSTAVPEPQLPGALPGDGEAEPAVPPCSGHRGSAEPCAGPETGRESCGHDSEAPKQPPSPQLQWGCGRLRDTSAERKYVSGPGLLKKCFCVFLTPQQELS